ncbi:STAS domain-containing protein [bacterium]|nr:STAS domain-containing protein [bacterium]
MKNKVTITQTTKGTVRLVTFNGFLDMTEVGGLEKILDQLIQEGHTKIVLDMTNLDYISSAGLGAIIGRIREVRTRKGDIKVGGCSTRVFDILKVFGFTDVFDVLETASEAMKKFKGT